jgi:ArsR family transcriptional regulator
MILLWGSPGKKPGVKSHESEKDTMLDVQTNNKASDQATAEGDGLQPLVTLASTLLDLDRLRIAAALANGPANRMQLHEATGLKHRDLLRHMDNMQQAGLVKPVGDVRQPDMYTPYELDLTAFSNARKALGKYKGVKPRPTDARELVLDTFFRGGKLSAYPLKREQVVIILDEVARKFEPDRQYAERDVNVILEEVNSDYCTLRRYLVDYGYLNRDKGIYQKRET